MAESTRGSGPLPAEIWKFGDFELDLRAYELRRAGQSLKLERIPMELLCKLLEKQGQLVTRDAIIERLWGKHVFLDTDNSINTAIRKIRQVLQEDPNQPRFVQTVPGKGYRFVGPVVRVQSEDGSPAPRQSRIMLAVLPFENLSNDIAQEYFSDGLTEETISHLGRLSPENMGVIARTSSMVYKRTRKSIAEIGPELGVDYVLEGTVRREENRVRITAQLIRVKDQIHLWAQNYDRELGSVLSVQSELGIAIAQQVQLRLTSQEKLQLANSREPDPEAHDLYLRGRHHWAKRTFPEIQKAIEYFRKAADRDPTYANAYAGLADCYIILPITSDLRAGDCFPKATAAVNRALELNDALSEAYTSLGTIRFWFDWDWAAAEAAYQRALELNPNYVIARLYRAHCLSNTGRHEEAIAEIKRACKLDPLSPILNTLLAEFLYHSRKYDQAIAEFSNALELAPNFWIAHFNLAKVHEQLGDSSRAISELKKARAFSEGNTQPLGLLAYVLATCGRKQEAEAVLAELLGLADTKYVPPFNIALAYAGLGNHDLMFRWLDQACEDRDVQMTFLLDPKWDRFHEDSRFQEILRRVGLENPWPQQS